MFKSVLVIMTIYRLHKSKVYHIELGLRFVLLIEI